jgi:hypothetical protein
VNTIQTDFNCTEENGQFWTWLFPYEEVPDVDDEVIAEDTSGLRARAIITAVGSPTRSEGVLVRFRVADWLPE